MADLTIHPNGASVSIVPGGDAGSQDFTFRLGRDEVSASWCDLSLHDETGKRLGGPDDETPLGMITTFGTYTAPDRPYVVKGAPQRKVQLRASTLDGTARKDASCEITLRLGWPEHWPYFANAAEWIQGGRAWDDDFGRRAALVLYDILLQLPDEYVERVGTVPILRHEALKRPFHSPLPFAFVVLDESYLDVRNPKVEKSFEAVKDPVERAEALALYHEHVDPSGVGKAPTPSERELGLTFLHEFAHVYMTSRCGGADAINRDLLRMTGQVFEDVAIQVTAGIVIAGAALGAVWLLPVLPLLFWAGVNGYERHTQNRDFMSEYAGPLGWKTPNYSTLSFPVIGALFTLASGEPPNVVTASSHLVGKWIGLRHDRLFWSPEPDPKTAKTAELTAWLDNVGFASAYATTDPHEDWAEACMIRAVGDKAITAQRKEGLDLRAQYLDIDTDLAAYARPVRPLDRYRSTAVNALYRSTKKVKPVVFGAALGDYASWEIDVKPRVANRTLLGIDGDDLSRLLNAAQTWEDGPGQTFQRTQAIIRDLKDEDPEPSTLGFLRTLERHGDGLRRYTGPDHEVAEGDVLIARNGNPFVVVRVDDKNRAFGVTGLPAELSAKTTSADLRVPLDDLRYHWTPAREPRSFGKHEAYADLDTTLTALVGLWGRNVTADGKRPLDGVGPFFAEALRVAGLEIDDFALPKEPRQRDVVAFWHTHGNGMRRWQPGAFEVAAGDWVLFHDENLAGVVTRVVGGVPRDVLAGGWPPDPEPRSYRDVVSGDAPYAVRMLHDVDPLDVHWAWRASGAVRTFGRTP